MAEEATNRTGRAVKGTLVSFLQYGIQILLQAFLAPLVLRMAGQETLGAYAILTQILGYLAMLDLGVSVSLNVFMAKAKGFDDNGKRMRDVLSTARTYLCVSNGLISILILVLSIVIGNFFPLTPEVIGSVRYSLILLAGWQLLKSPWSVFGIGLNATQNLAAYNFIGIIGNAGRLVFSIGLVASGFGLTGLIAGNVLAEVLTCILSTVHFRRLYPTCRPAWGIPNKALLREMLIFGVQSLLISVAWRLVYLTDNIVVGYLYGAAAVSIYYSTQMPTTIAFNIVTRVQDNASPALNELQARREDAKLRKSFLQLHRISILLSLPMGIGVYLLNEQLITLWVGAGQYAGASMSVALACFILLTTLNHLTFIFFITSGRILVFGIVGIVEGVFNLGLSFWLGKVLGLSGVMWASVIANLPATLLVLYISMCRMRIGIPEFMRSCVLRAVLPAAISCGVTFFAGRMMPTVGWVSFTIKGSILIAVYGAFVYMFNLTNEERAWINARLMRFIRTKQEANAGGAG